MGGGFSSASWSNSPRSLSLHFACAPSPCRATVAGHQRAALEAAPIARMMVRLATVNAAVGLPRRLVPPHLAMHTVPLKVTSDLTAMSNGMGMVGQYKGQVEFTARPRGI